MDAKQALGLTEMLLDRTRPGSVSAPYRKQPLLVPGSPLSPTYMKASRCLIESWEDLTAFRVGRISRRHNPTEACVA